MYVCVVAQGWGSRWDCDGRDEAVKTQNNFMQRDRQDLILLY